MKEAERVNESSSAAQAREEMEFVLHTSLKGSPDSSLEFPKVADEVYSHLRLIPLTSESIESRLVNNDTFQKAQEIILSVINPLQDAYQKMSQKLNS